MRVGQKQKKIDINIPKLDDFIHKAYVNVARKVYKNVYLFEMNSAPLQVQRHNRELEIIVQECILNAVRESIPIENILKAYMDETVEEDVIEEIKEQIIEKPETPNGTTESEFIAEGKGVTPSLSQGLSFNDVDSVLHKSGKEEMVNAPKTIERLEEISNLRAIQRKIEEEDDDMLRISDENVELNGLDVHVIGGGDMKLNNDFLLNDIEVLA
jgi:NADPH-dependent glutamate synthase beta subunit-like oxidoreductase